MQDWSEDLADLASHHAQSCSWVTRNEDISPMNSTGSKHTVGTTLEAVRGIYWDNEFIVRVAMNRFVRYEESYNFSKNLCRDAEKCDFYKQVGLCRKIHEGCLFLIGELNLQL